jgi:hypothetical protein
MLAALPDSGALWPAIVNMDDGVLGPEKIELLLLNLPSAAEESMMISAAKEAGVDADDELWDGPEQFVSKLVKITEYEFHIKLWSFMSSIEGALERSAAASKEAMLAADCLQKSARIEKLLAVTLNVGNHLNGGTQRGRADGFDLDILGKLAELKASQQGTLVDFIAAQVEKDAPGMLRALFAPGAEFELVHQVRRLDMTEMREEVLQLHTQGQGLLQKLHQLAQSSDALASRVVTLATIVDRLQTLAAQYELWDQRYGQLCAWFRIDPKKPKASHEFFGLWDAFLSDVQKASEGIEQRKLASCSERPLSVAASRHKKAPCSSAPKARPRSRAPLKTKASEAKDKPPEKPDFKRLLIEAGGA